MTDKWARRWKSVPIEQRRRIAHAVARGEAVADPRDAPLAVELAERKQQQLQSRRSGWFSRWILVIYAGSGVLAVAVARDLVFAVLFVVSLLCFAASRATVRRIERRAGEARAKNEQLAEL